MNVKRITIAKALFHFLVNLTTNVGCQLTFQLFVSCQLFPFSLQFVTCQLTSFRPSVNVNTDNNYDLFL